VQLIRFFQQQLIAKADYDLGSGCRPYRLLDTADRYQFNPRGNRPQRLNHLWAEYGPHQYPLRLLPSRYIPASYIGFVQSQALQ
jgi:hypothetical protein